MPTETMVPDAKEYISETISNPEALYDPADMGIHLGSRWSFRGSHKNGIEDAAHSHLEA